MYSLQSYLDDTGTDLVADWMDGYSYADKSAKAIWALYRYAVINACNTETGITRWIQRCKDIAYQLDERYSQLITAYESLKESGDATSIKIIDKSTTTTTDKGTSDQSTSTTDNRTAKTTTVTDDGATSETTTTSEDIPQSADASASQWLNNRETTKGATTQDTTVTEDSTGTDTGTATVTESDTRDGTSTTERTSTYGLIPLELFQRMKDGLFNPYYEYAQEFRDMFMPFYADECCSDTECWI